MTRAKSKNPHRPIQLKVNFFQLNSSQGRQLIIIIIIVIIIIMNKKKSKLTTYEFVSINYVNVKIKTKTNLFRYS